MKTHVIDINEIKKSQCLTSIKKSQCHTPMKLKYPFPRHFPGRLKSFSQLSEVLLISCATSATCSGLCLGANPWQANKKHTLKWHSKNLEEKKLKTFTWICSRLRAINFGCQTWGGFLKYVNNLFPSKYNAHSRHQILAAKFHQATLGQEGNLWRWSFHRHTPVTHGVAPNLTQGHPARMPRAKANKISILQSNHTAVSLFLDTNKCKKINTPIKSTWKARLLRLLCHWCSFQGDRIFSWCFCVVHPHFRQP